MFYTYLKSILRRLWRQKLYSVLNITGLSLGLAVSLLMFGYVRDEMKFDRHFPDADNLYRIIQHHNTTDAPPDWANGAPLMAESIRDHIPEIESVTRLRPIYQTELTYYPDSLDIISQVAEGFYADSTFFDVFGTEILQGDMSHPLAEPRTMVISESLGIKIFGDEAPLGKSLIVNGGLFTITAIMKDFPEHTHFIPEFLLDWHTFKQMIYGVNLGELYENRNWAGVYTYARLEAGANMDTLKEKLKDFRAAYFTGQGTYEEINERGEFIFQPVRDIHLKSHLEQEIGPNNNILYVRVFALAALFIIIIAGVNYITIATAGSFRRIKETGIRKVSGALQPQLFRQFIGESLFTALISALLAILVLDLLLPFYNRIAENDLQTREFLDYTNLGFLALITVVLGITAGLYPAAFVSRFKPVEALREIKNPLSLTSKIRTGLVVFQFMISVFMIFTATSIYKQMNFFIKTDLGFDKENIMVFNLNNEARRMIVNNPGTLKDELGQLPFVLGTSAISHLPGRRFSVEGFTPDGTSDDTQLPAIRFLRVDEDFIPLMGIEITQGRNFQQSASQESELIANYTAVQALSLKDPVSTQGTTYFRIHGEIVGVCEDFHYASLHHQVEPLIMECNSNPESRNLWVSFLLIKLAPGDLAVMTEELKKKIEEVAPGTRFNHFYLDDEFNRNYKDEMKLRDLFRAFAAFAIFISCLGLFGLSAFSAALRTKEIGIRKAMGAGTLQITAMLPRTYLLLIMAGLVLALVPAFLFINWWLDNFAYHVQQGIIEFLISGLLTMVIGILSVSYTSLMAASGNPVNTLRYE